MTRDIVRERVIPPVPPPARRSPPASAGSAIVSSVCTNESAASRPDWRGLAPQHPFPNDPGRSYRYLTRPARSGSTSAFTFHVTRPGVLLCVGSHARRLMRKFFVDERGGSLVPPISLVNAVMTPPASLYHPQICSRRVMADPTVTAHAPAADAPPPVLASYSALLGYYPASGSAQRFDQGRGPGSSGVSGW